jgi:uncharacterized membrane protein YhhN
MKKSSTRLVYLAAIIALAGVVIHVGAVFGGPSWFAFFGAPPRVVASARAGTWLAPVSALVIATLMMVCAATEYIRSRQRYRLVCCRCRLCAGLSRSQDEP